MADKKNLAGMTTRSKAADLASAELTTEGDIPSVPGFSLSSGTIIPSDDETPDEKVQRWCAILGGADYAEEEAAQQARGESTSSQLHDASGETVSTIIRDNKTASVRETVTTLTRVDIDEDAATQQRRSQPSAAQDDVEDDSWQSIDDDSVVCMSGGGRRPNRARARFYRLRREHAVLRANYDGKVTQLRAVEAECAMLQADQIHLREQLTAAQSDKAVCQDLMARQTRLNEQLEERIRKQLDVMDAERADCQALRQHAQSRLAVSERRIVDLENELDALRHDGSLPSARHELSAQAEAQLTLLREQMDEMQVRLVGEGQVNQPSALTNVIDRLTSVVDQLANQSVAASRAGNNDHGCGKHKMKAPIFSGASEDPEVFLQLFNRYCDTNSITGDQKLDCLLSCLHRDVYTALFNAGLTDSPRWNPIVAHLFDAFGGNKSKSAWARIFNSVRRREGESLVALSKRFLAALRKAGVTIPLSMLKNKFVIALGKCQWAKWLLRAATISKVKTFDDFIDLAVTIEDDFMDEGKSIDVVAPIDEDLEDVVDVIAAPPATKQSTPPVRASPRLPTPDMFQRLQDDLFARLSTLLDQRFAAVGAQPVSPPPVAGGRPRRQRRGCYGCDSKDHSVRDCPYPCVICGRKGHTAVVCKDKNITKNGSRDAHIPPQ